MESSKILQERAEHLVITELRESFKVQPVIDPTHLKKEYPPWILIVQFLKLFNKGNLMLEVTLPIKNDVCGRLTKREITDPLFSAEMESVLDYLREG